MRILWITNIMLPPVCEALHLPPTPVGGWMVSSLCGLKSEGRDHEYAVATVWHQHDFKEVEVDGVRYYLLPGKNLPPHKYDGSIERYWRQIGESYKPDVVHVHGTEYSYGLAYLKANGGRGMVASIQGIVSSIARYYAAGVDSGYVNRCVTLRDFLKRDWIGRQQKKFELRGRLECEFIRGIDHVIGRTDWDHAHVRAINPDAAYHYCGETLRPSFYNNKWKYEECEPCSIFVSQGSYPVKGLHQLLKAMPLIVREYPEAKIYVAGGDIVNVPFYRISGYAGYLRKLINERGLEGRVIFTGSLTEEEMCRRYLRSNVFVCPSSIENSPNSLGEAQLLGMPHVASFVGGTPDIAGYNSEVLYRFEEYEMLADKICSIFAMGNQFIAGEYDATRYDPELNRSRLLGIYDAIANRDNSEGC